MLIKKGKNNFIVCKKERMGTLLGKMLSSLKIKRDKYKVYEDDIQELKKFRKKENISRTGRKYNRKKTQRPPARRKKVNPEKTKSRIYSNIDRQG